MFNSLSALPEALYKIMEYLVAHNENIWKMLKYNGYDALNKPNLTQKEKMELLWRDGQQGEYSVFLTNLIEDEICVSRCISKIYTYYIHANPTHITSTVVFAFDFLYGGEMALVEKDGIPVNRGDVFIHEILNTLNGKFVGGVGTLQFNSDMSRYDSARSVIGNSKTFSGVAIYMSTLMGDTGEENGCGD